MRKYRGIIQDRRGNYTVPLYGKSVLRVRWMQQEGAYLIKVKLTYRDLKEKEEALKALERNFIVKNISKEYSRKKASDVYVDLELMA